jgi:uncharacterized lipoprotein YddW (UPF0748 family)
MRRLLSLLLLLAPIAAGAQARPTKAGAKPAATTAKRPATRATATAAAPATSAPPVPREFRGVWVATVANIDWPSRPGLSTQEQQQELRDLLDRAVRLRLNAVIFQVRPAGDALYASKIEPWSEYLTGVQGQRPDPYYDPLAFAITEAHARGLELHAWFNPYRARMSGAKSPEAASHIARRRPELVRRYGPFLWMDPGEAEVRAHTLRVVLDVVRRYDVDGIHIDDYFYPYRVADPNGGGYLQFPDDRSWRRYRRSGGKLARDDWRRRNVDLLVRQLYEGVHRVKPTVRFGISPFGIWRPGSPPSVAGLDAYVELYADSKKWLNNGWVDYFTPQLYWAVDRPQQRYDLLLRWWAEQNTKRRHLWPGNFTSKVGGTGPTDWHAGELVEQIRLTRADPGASGNVHFSARALVRNQEGLSDWLETVTYAEPALVPSTRWLDRTPPATPRVTMRPDSTGGVRLALAPGARESPWLWTLRARYGDEWRTQILPGATRSWLLGPLGIHDRPDELVVNAVDRVGNTSTGRVVR